MVGRSTVTRKLVLAQVVLGGDFNIVPTESDIYPINKAASNLDSTKLSCNPRTFGDSLCEPPVHCQQPPTKRMENTDFCTSNGCLCVPKISSAVFG
jgi:hypothetical protein